MTSSPMPPAEVRARLWSALPLPLLLVLLNLIVAGIYVVLRVSTAREQRHIEAMQNEQHEMEAELEEIRAKIQDIRDRTGAHP